MFTDTEVALMMRHRRDMVAVVNDAQVIVDRQAVQIRKLRRALNAQQAANSQMRADIGQRAIDDLLAFRSAKRLVGR